MTLDDEDLGAIRAVVREEFALALEGMRPSNQRATRLAATWELPRNWGLWAMQEQPTWTADHVRTQAATFRDYWSSKSGQGATKTDWEATWRNWVRRAGPMLNSTAQGDTPVVSPAIEQTRRLLESQRMTPEQEAASKAAAAQVKERLQNVVKLVRSA